MESSSSLLAQRPASLVPGTAPETTVLMNTVVVNFASSFQDIPGQYIKEIYSGEFMTFLSYKLRTCHCTTCSIILSYL